MGPKSLVGHYQINISINKDAHPFGVGIWGAGRLALRMLLPVGVVVAFVAHRTLMRVRADVSAHVLHAHDAQRTVLGSANVIVHVVSAADAAAGLGLLAVSGDLPAVLTRASGLGFGAGGFFVVVSGAHANIVAHSW